MSTSTSPRAFIFANGEVANIATLRRHILSTDTLISADGGMRYLAALGLLPEVVIGDLDSLAAGEEDRLRMAGIEIQRHPVAKDATDLELALEWALARGFHVIRIAGAVGGRLDHTLGNLFLLADPRLAELDVRLEDGSTEIALIRKQAEIDGQEGDLLSLVPIQGDAHGVWTEGLTYPLKGETLLASKTRGISNVFSGSHARVGLTHGLLLYIHTRK